MKRLTAAAALAALAAVTAACDLLTPPAVAGDCIAVVYLDGRYFVAMGTAESATDFSPGALYATVTRYRECQDTVTIDESGAVEESIEPLEDGESNFLPEGTPLHRVDGYPPTERLAADTEYGWELVAVQHAADFFVADGLRVRLQLDAMDVDPPVTLTATLAYDNMTDGELAVTSSAGCPAFVGVYRGEARIPFPATDFACTAAITTWTIPATQTMEWTYSLEIGPDATPLEPGAYTFVADLNTHDRSLARPFEVR